MTEYFFNVCLEIIGLELVISSANRKGMEILPTILGKSLIYIKNSKGPRIDPQGTPYEILVRITTRSIMEDI